MSLLASDQLAESLHESNSRLEILLEGLIPAGTDGAAPSGGATRREAWAATPQQMGGLLSELMRAGESLRALPPEKDPALEQELGEYRKNVERLRQLMPQIHGALLRERARLEQERGRVESAAAWARRSRETL